MSSFLERVKEISNQELANLLEVDVIILNNDEVKSNLQKQLANQFENDEVDEIELIIIESGM